MRASNIKSLKAKIRLEAFVRLEPTHRAIESL